MEKIGIFDDRIMVLVDLCSNWWMMKGKKWILLAQSNNVRDKSFCNFKRWNKAKRKINSWLKNVCDDCGWKMAPFYNIKNFIELSDLPQLKSSFVLIRFSSVSSFVGINISAQHIHGDIIHWRNLFTAPDDHHSWGSREKRYFIDDTNELISFCSKKRSDRPTFNSCRFHTCNYPQWNSTSSTFSLHHLWSFICFPGICASDCSVSTAATGPSNTSSSIFDF